MDSSGMNIYFLYEVYYPGNAFNHIMTQKTKGLVNTWTIHEEEEPRGGILGLSFSWFSSFCLLFSTLHYVCQQGHESYIQRYIIVL